MPKQKGEFEPFKMLIGAVMALMILAIIVSAIDYFNRFRLDISKERLIDGLKNAVEQPNGKTLAIQGLLFEERTGYTNSFLAKEIGLEGPQCISFLETDNFSSIATNDSGVSINSSIQADVYPVCYTNTAGECQSDCQLCCVLAFNRDPNNP